MKKLILFLSIICGSGLAVVSIYNTVVDAKSWGSDIPASFKRREITFSMLIQGVFTRSPVQLISF